MLQALTPLAPLRPASASAAPAPAATPTPEGDRFEASGALLAVAKPVLHGGLLVGGLIGVGSVASWPLRVLMAVAVYFGVTGLLNDVDPPKA